MVKQWYDYTLLIGRGDPAIVGEHGIDVATWGWQRVHYAYTIASSGISVAE